MKVKYGNYLQGYTEVETDGRVQNHLIIVLDNGEILKIYENDSKSIEIRALEGRLQPVLTGTVNSLVVESKALW